MAPPKKEAKGGKKKKTPKSQVNCIIKYIVFGFNVFFWIVGAVILGAGIWAYTQKATFDNFAKITNTNLFDPVLFVIVIGGVIFVVGFLGCIGALRENTKLLQTYTILVGLYLAVEVTFMIILFAGKNWYMSAVGLTLLVLIIFVACALGLRDMYKGFVGTTLLGLIIIVALAFGMKSWFSIIVGVILFLQLIFPVLLLTRKIWLKDQISEHLKKMIEKYRDDHDLQNMIDWMQADWLHCCGLKGPDDWESNEYFNCSSPSREACGVPFSCCIEDPDALIVNTQCGYDTRDPELTANPEEKIYTDGCVDAGEKWLNKNLVPVAGVLVAVALVQIIALLMAFMLMRGATKDRENKLYLK